LSKEELAEQVIASHTSHDRKKPPYVFGELSLSIDPEKYRRGVHGDMACIDCHQSVNEIPHPQRLESVDCETCHEAENIKSSAHGEHAELRISCIGCHDVHYGEKSEIYDGHFRRKVCLDCHSAYRLDNYEAHRKLHARDTHLSLDCVTCHTSADRREIHTMPLVKEWVATCESCHNPNTVLSDTDSPVSVSHTSLTNKQILKQYGYVMGAHRIQILDFILIVFFAVVPFSGVVIHGGFLLAIYIRKKRAYSVYMRILMHPLLERLWHWGQAGCIVMLILTGIAIHWPELFPEFFEISVTLHHVFGISVVGFFFFWLFYNLITGRIRHYLPKKGEIPTGLIEDMRYYLYGIFRGEQHPHGPTPEEKFGPLKKLTYFQFQVVFMPLLLASGVIYFFKKTFSDVIEGIGGIWVLASIHLTLGGVFVFFLLTHLYLATNRKTSGESLASMVDGYMNVSL
jgi:thiosulfate reductase cytochrome b subunit